jgi:hypothetical protein
MPDQNIRLGLHTNIRNAIAVFLFGWHDLNEVKCAMT